jgi:competence protein ComEA
VGDAAPRPPSTLLGAVGLALVAGAPLATRDVWLDVHDVGRAVELCGDIADPGPVWLAPPTLRQAAAVAGQSAPPFDVQVPPGVAVCWEAGHPRFARPSDPMLFALRVRPDVDAASALESVPSIGPSLARAIIEDRSRRGAFCGVADLDRVKGVGPTTLARIAPYLEVDARPGCRPDPGGGGRAKPQLRPVRINRASPSELDTLPGIGPALASRILARRREAPFQSLADLDAVKGIGPATLEKLKPWVIIP